MPIEFRCTHCDRLLRTPDGTEGKEAKCPQCGTLSKVPDPAQPATASPPPVPQYTSPRETGNPYQSPAATMMAAAPAGGMRRGFHPARIDLGEVLSRTWSIYKANLWPCVAAGLVLIAVSWGESIGFLLVTRGRQPTAGEQGINLLFSIVQWWLMLGELIFLLKIARGEPAAFADVFSGGRFLLPAIGLGFLVGLMYLIGFLLCIIPGLIVLIMFGPSFLMLLDQGVGVFDSLKMSRQATNGNKLTLFALMLVTGMGAALFTLVTCLIGGIFAQPFSMLAWCVSYLMMTGQSTAAPAPAR
jgi:phage FluMu protein Com